MFSEFLGQHCDNCGVLVLGGQDGGGDIGQFELASGVHVYLLEQHELLEVGSIQELNPMLFEVLQFLINLVLYEFHRVPFRLGAPQVADQLAHSLWSQLTVPLALQQRDHWVRVLQLQSPTQDRKSVV